MRSAAGFFAVCTLFSTACGGDGYLQAKKKPTAEEVAAREAFIESHPDLDPVLRRQLRAFEVTPEAALRRQEYVGAHPRLAPRARRLVLLGEVVREMTLEQVEASWGPPDLVETLPDTRGGKAVVRWTYRRAAGPYHPGALVTRLTFEDGRLVDLQERTQ
jgi:hypothetical protein